MYKIMLLLLLVLLMGKPLGGVAPRPRLVALRILASPEPATKEVWGVSVLPAMLRFKQTAGPHLDKGTVLLCSQEGLRLGRADQERLPDGNIQVTTYLVLLHCESGVQLEVSGVSLSPNR